jgi:hypothetical protein
MTQAAAHAADRSAPPPGRGGAGASRARDLATALESLAEASDALTIAVERHDLTALIAASDRAERLTERVGALAADLDAVDRIDLDGDRIAGLRERLATSSRRNAYLIERAWALDAATMRILAGVGQGNADAGDERPIATYRAPGNGPLHLDREA